MDVPVIVTDRLVLSVPNENHVGAMTTYVKENRDHLAPWEATHDAEYFTEPYWRGQIARWVSEFQEDKSIRLFLLNRSDPESGVIGHCGFSNIIRGSFHACHLGYSLDYRGVGKGLMFEALKAAIDYAFETKKLHRIMANYMPANVRSARLLRRLNFNIEGYAREYLRIAGKWEDHILTSVTNPRFE
jgi:[ribosomal protein S5]-alanine N-acetyltransferase